MPVSAPGLQIPLFADCRWVTFGASVEAHPRLNDRHSSEFTHGPFRSLFSIHMQLCKVTGTIVSSRKAPSFRDGKLLIVHPIDTLGDLEGEMDMLAIDPGYGAGMDDVVIVAREGSVVKQLMRKEDVPANVIILGVVDDWSAEA